MKKYHFIFLLLFSCTSKQNTSDIVMNKKIDSLTRILTDTKHEFKTTVTALSLTWYTKTEVDTKIIAAVKIPNDKIADMTIQMTKLVADTLAKSKRIKVLEDTVSKAIKYLGPDFNYDIKNQIQISPAGIQRIKKTP